MDGSAFRRFNPVKGLMLVFTLAFIGLLSSIYLAARAIWWLFTHVTIGIS